MTLLTEDFIDSTPKSFLRTLNFIQNLTQQNLLMTGASITSVLPRTQHLMILQENIPYDGMKYIFTDNSSCICSSSSANTCIGLATYKGIPISGFYTGCYMFNALLHSTLDIFFNQTLLNIVTQSRNEFQILNSSFSNRITVQSLLQQMFVTHWFNKTSFEDYFKQCAPISCQYRIVQRYDFLFILTTMIGLIGGLSTALRIITSFLVVTLWPIIWKFIQQKKTRHVIQTNVEIIPIRIRIKQFFRLVKQKWIELNLFTTQTIHITIKSPSSKDFLHLYEQYPRTLHCPCSHTTFNQELVFSMEPEYHQVCSSQFISSDWIKIKFIKSSKIRLITYDIRYQWEFYFQLLSTLCQMANQTIEDSLQSFYRTKCISNELFTPQSFQTQIDLLIEEFKRTLPESYQRTIQLIRTNFEINQFITPMNSYFTSSDLDNEICQTSDDIYPNSCYCFSEASYECYQYIKLKDIHSTFIIPEMYQTWFPLQAFLMSTLECFYNQTCLSHIVQYMNLSQSSTNLTILNSSLLKSNKEQYDRLEILVNNLFLQSYFN
ncbi:hypothetical protein I4U23_015973 [Adineta vaga]|nr:hypothetical protein I4U23_015973 [Adineta vaga]